MKKEFILNYDEGIGCFVGTKRIGGFSNIDLSKGIVEVEIDDTISNGEYYISIYHRGIAVHYWCESYKFEKVGIEDNE